MDELIVRKNQINHQVTVLDIPKNRVGAKLVDIYRKDTTPTSAFEHTELLQYSKDYYRKKGAGRPTKKDRREIDDYLDSPASKNTDEKKSTTDTSEKEDL
tara:strand:- start:156922 stop:157221 length:300 start_codon:yes stop_codon:yes gene_type:complete